MKSTGEACLIVVVKGDILRKGIKLDLESMTLNYVVQETTKTDWLGPMEGGQNNEIYYNKGLVDYEVVLCQVLHQK